MTGVNDAPVAINDGSTGTPIASTTSDAPLTGQPTLFGNDGDPDTGDTLSLNTADTTSPKGATVTVNSNGTWSYDPTTSSTLQALTHGQSTTDTFTYSVKDNHGLGSTPATVTVGITGVNHAPVATADSASAQADTPMTVTAPGVLSNDTDLDSDPLTVTKLNGSSTLTGTSTDGAAVTIHADGSYSYDPTGSATLKALGVGAQTTDTFTYTIDDGHGGTSSATVSITVTGVNDAPVAINDGSTGTPIASTTSDAPLTGQPTLFGNDGDPDTGDTLSLNTADTTSPKGATVTVNSNGTWSYDPTTSSTLQALTHGQSTTDTFTYSVKDNHGLGSTPATVTVGITGVNHAPVANPDNESTSQSGPPLLGNVLANDTDADGDLLTATLVSPPSDASAFSLNSDGSFSYTPAPGHVGQTDTFTYKANDGFADSNTTTVSIIITA